MLHIFRRFGTKTMLTFFATNLDTGFIFVKIVQKG